MGLQPVVDVIRFQVRDLQSSADVADKALAMILVPSQRGRLAISLQPTEVLSNQFGDCSFSRGRNLGRLQAVKFVVSFVFIGAEPVLLATELDVPTFSVFHDNTVCIEA